MDDNWKGFENAVICGSLSINFTWNVWMVLDSKRWWAISQSENDWGRQVCECGAGRSVCGLELYNWKSFI